MLLMPGEAFLRPVSSLDCLNSTMSYSQSSFHPRHRIRLTNLVGASMLILRIAYKATLMALRTKTGYAAFVRRARCLFDCCHVWPEL